MLSCVLKNQNTDCQSLLGCLCGCSQVHPTLRLLSILAESRSATRWSRHPRCFLVRQGVPTSIAVLKGDAERWLNLASRLGFGSFLSCKTFCPACWWCRNLLWWCEAALCLLQWSSSSRRLFILWESWACSKLALLRLRGWSLSCGFEVGTIRICGQPLCLLWGLFFVKRPQPKVGAGSYVSWRWLLLSELLLLFHHGLRHLLAHIRLRVIVDWPLWHLLLEGQLACVTVHVRCILLEFSNLRCLARCDSRRYGFLSLGQGLHWRNR